MGLYGRVGEGGEGEGEGAGRPLIWKEHAILILFFVGLPLTPKQS